MIEKVKVNLLFNYLEELTRKYEETFELKERLLKELKEKAMYDSLTGTYNRHILLDFLEKELKRLERTKKGKIYFVFMDLDKFKLVNDVYGHKKGDEVLKKVAKIIKDSFREYDIVSRFGGDEFVVVVKDDSGKSLNSILQRIKEKIESAFSSYGISISYGVAVAPDEGLNSNTLLQLADKRMYEMKKKKRRENEEKNL
ncbi:diguanylate cyclase [Desulfurobacterium thermolithotrophum DSM 11699]|uniref:diguanylate cyclase n=1 Tax=Desulfurobacterium thermolithotrophum (strain DSM 11699 / BSA) TaxID=868864 RepID=F0S0H5_DESTD|nr:GGDEF domain-containing protein [Desulfurobacterium thermolithotrophum]ADY72703.1 diguanylate cyclase [Desulfurobacterium thermolithotrophum DSM 11699]